MIAVHSPPWTASTRVIQGTYLFASHIAPTFSNDEESCVESTCEMPMSLACWSSVKACENCTSALENYLRLIYNASRLQEISHEKNLFNITIYLNSSFLLHMRRMIFITESDVETSFLSQSELTVLLSHGKYKHLVDYIRFRSSSLFYSDCAMFYPNFFTKYNMYIKFFMFQSVSFCLSFLFFILIPCFSVWGYFPSFCVLVFGGIFHCSAF